MPIYGHSMANHIDDSKLNLETLRAQAAAQGDDKMLSAVTQNTELLQQLFDRLQQEGMKAEPEAAFDPLDDLYCATVDEEAIEAVDENIRLREEVAQLNAEIDALVAKNHDLASKVVYGNTTQQAPRATTSSSSTDTESLSWEERKRQILEQLENESFDAEEFLTTLHIETPASAGATATADAIDFVNELSAERDRLLQAEAEHEHQVKQDERQIKTLKDSLAESKASVEALTADLQQQDEQVDQPNPIADLLDNDDLIKAERETLRRMQDECEQKLRQIEIESSVARARQAREQTTLEQKNQQLETQVAALQRQAGMNEPGGIGTRWMEKLGLTRDLRE